ncbi:hypothetical protein EMIT0347P_20011 [Pseudomonas sp. IT-347P]
MIYPWTESFTQPLPVFDFTSSKELKLWVVPFCIKSRKLLLPETSPLGRCLYGSETREFLERDRFQAELKEWRPLTLI